MFILAASLRLAPTDAEASTPVIVTADNVDLDGAGSLVFIPNPSTFHADPPTGGDGISLTVRLWFDAHGRPVSCDQGHSPLPMAQTGCEQLMASASFRRFPGLSMPLQRGFVDVQFSFYNDPQHFPVGEHMFATAFPGYKNTTIVYPDDDTPADQMLHHQTDGTFIVPMDESDYPPMALRYLLESRSRALLGISRDGKVITCRPISSPLGPNTAFLDNYTCDFLIRRGHFEFAPAAPTYTGLRYLPQKITWLLPH